MRHVLNATFAPFIFLAACGGSTSGGTPDMTGGGTTLTKVPSCAAATVTSTQLYANEVQANCALSSCHGTSDPMNFGIASAAALKTTWVGKPATELPSMNYVTAGNINQSYVMYKLLNEQGAAGGLGAQMPLVGQLQDSDICQFINWIKGGAD